MFEEYIVDKVICRLLFPVYILAAIVLLVVTYIIWRSFENYNFNLGAIIKEIKKVLLMEWNRNMTIFIILALIILYVLNRSEYCQLKRIQGTFEKRLDFAEQPKCFVNTSNMRMMIKALNRSGDGVYSLVKGPHGCGKTTILLEAAKHVGNNIVYVSVNNYEDFGLTLANALSVDMDCEKYHPYIQMLYSLFPMNHNCPGTSVEKLKMWWKLMDKALLQMRNDGKPTPVIIIDHLNHLVSGTSQEGIDLLYLLQGFAKEMADKRLVTMFFISGEETVYRMLLQKSAKSRMMQFPNFHWEISYEEAINYFRCLCNTTVPEVDNITISRVIDIVGGYFAHILDAKNVLNLVWSGDSDAFVRQVKAQLFNLVISKLQQLGVSAIPINATDIMSIVTWSLATKLINSEATQISFEEASIIMEPLLEEQKRMLRDANIFSFDLVKKKVSFQWKLVQAYFKEETRELV